MTGTPIACRLCVQRADNGRSQQYPPTCRNQSCLRDWQDWMRNVNKRIPLITMPHYGLPLRAEDFESNPFNRDIKPDEER